MLRTIKIQSQRHERCHEIDRHVETLPPDGVFILTGQGVAWAEARSLRRVNGIVTPEICGAIGRAENVGMPILAEAPESATIVNYFDSPDAARRYAAFRPRGQARALAMMASVIDQGLPVARALDVGCGTGNSTVALLPYAKSIVGLDPSASMLVEAPRHPNVEYRRGYAEALPFRGTDFDLVTASSAYHWFDHERFLSEVARVLRPGGWLVLYKAGSTGTIAHSTAFAQWRREVFHTRYPKVARNSEPLTAERAAGHGFVECAHEVSSYSLRHSLDRYVDNLLSHSSVLRAIDYRMEPVTTVRAWLQAELKPFFSDNVAEFTHECRIHVLRRLGE